MLPGTIGRYDRAPMERRTFVFGGLAFVAAPPAEGAQSAAVRRIGFISNSPLTPITESFYGAFVAGLNEHGWIEARNITIDRRYAVAGSGEATAVAEDLVRAGVEVIVVSATETALAAKQVTRTVPIVMTVPADPVAVGLVASLARPGGNVTGLSFLGTEVAGKQVELLKTAVANLTSIAVVANPQNPSHAPRMKEARAVARALRLDVHLVEARAREQIGDAFRAMAKRPVGAALVLADPMFVREADTMIRLAAEHRLPVMYGLREAPLAGGLMSYGPSFSDLFRRAGGYVDKLLRGASPQELPIEQASKFELVINLRTARALGLTMPSSLLVRADQVIE